MKSFRNNFAIITALFAVLASSPAFSLTLDEAVARAKASFPGYKSSIFKAQSTEALYNASLGPYLPSIDASSDLSRHYTSLGDYDQRVYNIAASYTLFDSGKRKAERAVSYLNFVSDTEDRRKSLIELVYNVKVSFYTAIAQKEALEQRKVQLDDAKKDFEVAQGRHKFGIAKLIDVLQASVRLEQARFNLVRTEGDLQKALSDLNSLVGDPLENAVSPEGSLDFVIALPDRKYLFEIALQKPEIKQAEAALEIADRTSDRNRSQFFPVVSLNASYTRTTGGIFRTFAPDDRTIGLKATWNIFELGKIFRQKASDINIEVSRQNLDNALRQIKLDVHKIYEDVVVAVKSLNVARQQLKTAEQNYAQAFGQYKIGTSDILTLIQAESLLANAREQLISAKLNAMLSRTLLERLVGVETIETLVRY